MGKVVDERVRTDKRESATMRKLYSQAVHYLSSLSVAQQLSYAGQELRMMLSHFPFSASLGLGLNPWTDYWLGGCDVWRVVFRDP